MFQASEYWTRKTLSRRAALRKAAAAAGGVAALSLAGCGGDDDEEPSTVAEPEQPDSAKGKPGGRFILQSFGDYGSLVLVSGGGQTPGAYTHRGLLEYKHGRPGVSGTSTETQPDTARAMPEQPDPLTLTFKLSPSKFHNGRDVTSEDVKYSLERYATDAKSRFLRFYRSLDSVQTPDAETVVIKNKTPYSDALEQYGALTLILAKEHEEGPDAAKKLIGSGPFLFVEQQPPVITRFRRNPDFPKPYPYFEQLDVLGVADVAKQLADWSAKAYHMSYWRDEEQRDQFKRARPDGILFAHPYPSHGIHFRTDVPPFNDKRVRQAFSMALDRKVFREALSKGEGEPDGQLSWTFSDYGFRKPTEYGAAAKYYNFNLQEAKQLMSATGIPLPIRTKNSHLDTTTGQAVVDGAVLFQAKVREAGFAEIEDIQLSFPAWTTSAGVGNYDGTLYWVGDGGGVVYVSAGTYIRETWLSPPEGVTPPTQNKSHVNNRRLSDLGEQQLREFDRNKRREIFREMETLTMDEMFYVTLSTRSDNFFLDPSVKNAAIPLYSYSPGSNRFVKYWWFE